MEHFSAIGTEAEPIIFTSNSMTLAPGFWKGISFGASSANSRLEHVQISDGGYGVMGISASHLLRSLF